jgi:hypothetical protein
MNHNGDQFGMSQEDVNSEMQSKMQAKYAPEMSQKGTSKRNLEKRAVEQQNQEDHITGRMSAAQRFDRDVKSGVQGARNAVN